jgi:hypothetical protein
MNSRRAYKAMDIAMAIVIMAAIITLIWLGKY